MVKTFSLLLVFLSALSAVVLTGLLTNWFRYSVSLQAVFVLIALFAAAALVFCTSGFAFAKESATALRISLVCAVAGAAVVMIVYEQAMGDFPRFYLNHQERGPPSTVQHADRPIEYWIELRNPFSKEHSESLVIRRIGEEPGRIAVPLSEGPITAFMSALEPSDWATLEPTANRDVLVLTLGPLLDPTSRRFKIDLQKGEAYETERENANGNARTNGPKAE